EPSERLTDSQFDDLDDQELIMDTGYSMCKSDQDRRCGAGHSPQQCPFGASSSSRIACCNNKCCCRCCELNFDKSDAGRCISMPNGQPLYGGLGAKDFSLASDRCSSYPLSGTDWASTVDHNHSAAAAAGQQQAGSKSK